jgi:cytochrome c peroxidase
MPSAETFAAIDFKPVPGAAERNRERLAKLIVEARRRGARYVVVPELSLVGSLDISGRQVGHFDPELIAETIPGPTTNYFARYARSLGVWIALSVVESGRGGTGYFLTSVLLDERGQITTRSRKTMVRLNGEDGQATRATNYLDVPDTVDDQGRRLGVLSGDDILVGVPRLAARGADTILVTAGWNDHDPVRWDELSRRLSKEFSVNLVIANRLSTDAEKRGSNAAKHGGIYTPSGQTFIADTSEEAKGLTVVSLIKRKPTWQIVSALGLPSVPVPSHQPPSVEIAELGRTLFFDKNLSSTKTVSCSTCHRPEKAFTNGETKGIGVDGRMTKRNAPSLLNVAFRPLLQWDGYASSIENFVKYPLSGYTEMNFHYIDQVVPYLRSQPEYAKAFHSSMGVEKIEFEDVERALATYVRTLISGNAPFDRYYYGRDEAALSESAKHGLKLFMGKAECSRCHLIGDHYALFMDSKYHTVGIGYDQAQGVFTDVGLGGISTDEFSGLFQTPSLRNVAETAPYMHDGSLGTLEEVIEFYNRGGGPSLHRDPILKPLFLSAQEKKDLLAFLHSLTGDQVYSSRGERLN